MAPAALRCKNNSRRRRRAGAAASVSAGMLAVAAAVVLNRPHAATAATAHSIGGDEQKRLLRDRHDAAHAKHLVPIRLRDGSEFFAYVGGKDGAVSAFYSTVNDDRHLMDDGGADRQRGRTRLLQAAEGTDGLRGSKGGPNRRKCVRKFVNLSPAELSLKSADDDTFEHNAQLVEVPQFTSVAVEMDCTTTERLCFTKSRPDPACWKNYKYQGEGEGDTARAGAGAAGRGPKGGGKSNNNSESAGKGKGKGGEGKGGEGDQGGEGDGGGDGGAAAANPGKGKGKGKKKRAGKNPPAKMGEINCFDPFENSSEITDVNLTFGLLRNQGPEVVIAHYDLKEHECGGGDGDGGGGGAERYRRLTGRVYVPPFHRRARGVHRVMWSAESFGERFEVDTFEAHDASLPTVVSEGAAGGGDDGVGSSASLRSSPSSGAAPSMTMTLEAVAPGVFEVPHFLSDAEVDHILELAQSLGTNETDAGGEEVVNAGDGRYAASARIERAASSVVEAMYCRAADLLGIGSALVPESYARSRREVVEADGEVRHPTIDEINAARDGDFGTEDGDELGMKLAAHGLEIERHTSGDHRERSRDEVGGLGVIDKDRYSEFAVLTVYLNEGVLGGETVKRVDMESGDILKITPRKGKAILSYSMLPDGNHDVLSQHYTLPVREGEVWIAKLRISDVSEYKRIVTA